MNYNDYLKTDHWKSLREKKRTKSNLRCVIAGIEVLAISTLCIKG